MPVPLEAEIRHGERLNGLGPMLHDMQVFRRPPSIVVLPVVSASIKKESKPSIAHHDQEVPVMARTIPAAISSPSASLKFAREHAKIELTVPECPQP